MNNTKAKKMVLAAILTAFTIIIPMVFTFFPLRLSFGAYTATLAVHAPTILAMFISPAVAVFVAVCSAIGFLFTSIPIVALRALSHVFFALLGAYMVKNHRNIYLIAVVTTLVHAAAEVLVVYFGSFFGMVPQNEYALMTMLGITFLGTAAHNIIDFLIAVVLMKALRSAKLM